MDFLRFCQYEEKKTKFIQIKVRNSYTLIKSEETSCKRDLIASFLLGKGKLPKHLIC
jgi:hypothetical protein